MIGQQVTSKYGNQLKGEKYGKESYHNLMDAVPDKNIKVMRIVDTRIGNAMSITLEITLQPQRS
jgi:hypothetical protein